MTKKIKIAYLPAAQNQKRTGKGLKFKIIPSSTCRNHRMDGDSNQ